MAGPLMLHVGYHHLKDLVDNLCCNAEVYDLLLKTPLINLKRHRRLRRFQRIVHVFVGEEVNDIEVRSHERTKRDVDEGCEKDWKVSCDKV